MAPALKGRRNQDRGLTHTWERGRSNGVEAGDEQGKGQEYMRAHKDRPVTVTIVLPAPRHTKNRTAHNVIVSVQ